MLSLLRVVAGVALTLPLTTAAGPGVDQATEPGSTPRPNIVLILTDDMAATDLAAMPRTRALLADQGTSFEHAYSPYPLCCPARASILSGQYAHNHGVLGNQSPDFPLGGWEAFDETSTIATWLHDVGYRTSYVGKYLNHYAEDIPVPKPVPPGWDEWNVSIGGGDYYATRLVHSDGSTTLYDGEYQTDLYTRLAVASVDAAAPGDQPFFLVTGYYAPHSGDPVEPDDPLVTQGISIRTPAVADRHRDTFAGTALLKDPSWNEADVSDKPDDIARRALISARLERAMTENHQQRLESLQAVDEGVEQIVEALAASGELANTIIVFSSDNGWLAGQHRVQAGKAFAYEPGLSVPLVIRGPGFRPGVTVAPPVTLVDLAPTFAALGRARPGLVVDGKSLLPLAASPATWPARPLIFMAGPRSETGPNYWTAVRAGQWLYTEYPETAEQELYDLVADPYQLENRAGDPALADTEARLAALLDRLRDCEGASCRRFQ